MNKEVEDKRKICYFCEKPVEFMVVQGTTIINCGTTCRDKNGNYFHAECVNKYLGDNWRG